MRIKSFLIFFILLLISCSKKEEGNQFPFNHFIFSSSGLRQNFSIKFTKSDSVYFQRRFPQPKETFYVILKNDQKAELHKFFKNLNLNKFEDTYQQDNVADGGTLQFEILKNKKSQLIFIYGGTAPQELYNHARFLIKFKDKLKFIKTKKHIYFGDQGPIFNPPPLPPPLKTE
jgi:hypothetical protein